MSFLQQLKNPRKLTKNGGSKIGSRSPGIWRHRGRRVNYADKNGSGFILHTNIIRNLLPNPPTRMAIIKILRM